MAADISKHLDRAKRFLEKNRVEDAIEAYLAVICMRGWSSQTAPRFITGYCSIC
jgi:hypothetical protein